MSDIHLVIEEYNNSLWVAGTKDGDLHSFEIDPSEEGVRWGSIYLARVDTIDTSLNAAFLNLGHGDSGILMAKDYRNMNTKGETTKHDGKPMSKLLKSGDMVLVQAKTANDPIAIQSPDASRESKSARMSMDISIPGRYLIYTPFDLKKKVSSRVTSTKIRKKMLDMIQDIDSMTGCIMRASASSMQTDVLVRESKILRAIWEQLQEFQDGQMAELIMLGPDAIQRTLGDNANIHISKIETLSPEFYDEAREWCDLYAPELMSRLRLIDGEEFDISMGLFDHYDLIPQIESLIRPFALLPSGGNIIIQETSALVAIDVNSGASKSKSETNIEAAQELTRQMRLRNLGGIIMADFINTGSKKEQNSIIKHIKDGLIHDPCSVDVHGFTKLGLLEISRERRTPSITDRFAAIMEIDEG